MKRLGAGETQLRRIGARRLWSFHFCPSGSPGILGNKRFEETNHGFCAVFSCGGVRQSEMGPCQTTDAEAFCVGPRHKRLRSAPSAPEPPTLSGADSWMKNGNHAKEVNETLSVIKRSNAACAVWVDDIRRSFKFPKQTSNGSGLPNLAFLFLTLFIRLILMRICGVGKMNGKQNFIFPH